MTTKLTESPATWLRRLGATRPMAPARDVVLVLGEWRDHFYPIEFKLVGKVESWRLFGFSVEPLKEADVVRILKQLKGAT